MLLYIRRLGIMINSFKKMKYTMSVSENMKNNIKLNFEFSLIIEFKNL